jgi:hypothetical protein
MVGLVAGCVIVLAILGVVLIRYRISNNKKNSKSANNNNNTKDFRTKMVFNSEMDLEAATDTKVPMTTTKNYTTLSSPSSTSRHLKPKNNTVNSSSSSSHLVSFEAEQIHVTVSPMSRNITLMPFTQTVTPSATSGSAASSASARKGNAKAKADRTTIKDQSNHQRGMTEKDEESIEIFPDDDDDDKNNSKKSAAKRPRNGDNAKGREIGFKFSDDDDQEKDMLPEYRN